MSNDYFNPPNSIWPNGLKRDEEGYVTFYPLGTNKVDITTIDWPEGDTLITPFVYKNDKLVGFVDTKALTVTGSATTTMNYNHIEADFSSISEGKLTVNAPNAVVKKFSWAVNTSGDETFDFVIIDFNTTDAETINTVRTAKRVVDNKLYDADDNLIGTWDTSKIEVGGIYDEQEIISDGLFCDLDNLILGQKRGLILSEFNSDLSSLTNGSNMFDSCTNLTTFSSDLSSLTDGRYMFYRTRLESFSSDLSNLTNGEFMFDYCTNLTSFSSDLSSLTDGRYMFYRTRLESFSSDLSSLTDGSYMFDYCTNLTSFSSDLSSLTDGRYMFYHTRLESFSSDLSSLTNGDSMFFVCTNLTSFTSNLPKLVHGGSMFQACDSLTSFNVDLPSLTNGSYMFNSCTNLTTFSSDLSSLTDGSYMFDSCTNLTTFSSDLSSLTNGDSMFDGCKLDAPSVKNIIDTINSCLNILKIGIGCNNTTEDKELFAQEIGYTDMTALLAAFETKGWDVYIQFNGRPNTTYSLRRPPENTLPVFVKLEETEKHVDYTSIDGSKKYMLKWFHETTGSTEGYTQFNSLEEAVAHFNIKPIERN